MSISVGKLYNSVKGGSIKLLAGEKGLDKEVRWVHIAESEEVCNFLQGNEMVLITGVALANSEELIILVKKAISQKVSGIILNLGPYIKEVQLNIIELCEEHEVPLFTAPWSTYMSEIMHKFCLMITLDDKKEIELSSAIKNAIFCPKQTELYIPYFQSYNINIQSEYIIILISIENKNYHEIEKKMLIRQIENQSYSGNWSSITVEIENDIVILFNDYDDEKADKFLNELKVNCSGLSKNIKCFFGIGESFKGIENIYKSYLQAKDVINIQKNNVLLDFDKKYSKLGLYKILLSIKDKELIRAFVEDTIGKLLRYDEINNSNLEEVLRIYLRSNGSVKETAEKLFIHRNTVNYKINKVNKILQINLSDYEECSLVILALKLYDILKL